MAISAKVADLMKRDDKLREQSMAWRSIWQDLADYLIPRKAKIITQNPREAPRKLTEKMFDSTGPDAVGLLASNMQGSLTSAAVKWFGLQPDDEELAEDAETAEYMQDSAAREYRAFQKSNLNSELQETYADLSVFGIGCIFMDELRPSARDWSGFRFQSIAVGDYAIDENAEGRVDTIFRDFQTSIRAAYLKWNDAIGDKLVKIMERDPYRAVTLTHAVYPREGGYRGAVGRAKPFASCYFLREQKQLVEEGGYEEMPYLVARWTKSSGEVYGRGPGITALPDVKSLNEAIKLDFKSWAKDLDPPVEVLDDGVIGSVKLGAAGINVVRAMGNVKALELGNKNYQATQIRAERLEAKIRKIFYSDQIQLPGSAPQKNTYMTAEEVSLRWEKMQEILGPTLGRLESELLAPMIERGYNMLRRRNRLMPLPDALKQAEKRGPLFSIKYEGPLARAQRSSEITSINRAVQSSAPIIQLFPESGQTIDADEAVRHIWVSAGAPPATVKDRRKLKEERAAEAEAQKAEAERQQQIQGAEAAGKAAPAIAALKDFQPPGGQPALTEPPDTGFPTQGAGA